MQNQESTGQKGKKVILSGCIPTNDIFYLFLLNSLWPLGNSGYHSLNGNIYKQQNDFPGKKTAR